MDEPEESQAVHKIAETLRDSIGFRSIDLTLDHPQDVFLSGREISGRIRLELNEPITAIGIRVKCKGEAQVYFTDRSAGIRRKFASDESYLHKEIYVVGDGREKYAITGGVYPFSLTLPENLPCSFEGRYGRVRYSIRALLDVTSVYRFSTNIIPFTVVSVLDLNRDPLAPLPVNESQSKVYMGQSDPISLTMSLPVRGYVPGQTIPIRINIKNQTSVVIKKLRIVFKKVVVYHSTEKSRKHKEIVVEIIQEVEKDTESYDVVFDVPAVPPTGLLCCNIINISYTIKVESCVDISEWYYRMFQKNIKLRSNLVIGTIPLANYESVESKVNNVEDEMARESVLAESPEGAIGRTEKLSQLHIPLYQKSRIYRSSKPDKDDPTGDDGDSDGEVKPYSPMYRVYKFEESGDSKTA